MTATISSTVGGSAGYTRPLFLGACPALWLGIAAGERRRPAASSNNSQKTSLPPFESRSLTRALSLRGGARHLDAGRCHREAVATASSDSGSRTGRATRGSCCSGAGTRSVRLRAGAPAGESSSDRRLDVAMADCGSSIREQHSLPVLWSRRGCCWHKSRRRGSLDRALTNRWVSRGRRRLVTCEPRCRGGFEFRCPLGQPSGCGRVRPATGAVGQCRARSRVGLGTPGRLDRAGGAFEAMAGA